MQSIKNIKKPHVFVPMSADFIHHGHINILLKAKKYGSVIVGLMTDNGIKSYKNKKPVLKYIHRKRILQQMKCVDYILPINGLKYTKFAKYYKFKYFVHGDDWKNNIQSSQRSELLELMKKWYGKVLEFKYTKNISSSKIKKLIAND